MKIKIAERTSRNFMDNVSNLASFKGNLKNEILHTLSSNFHVMQNLYLEIIFL